MEMNKKIMALGVFLGILAGGSLSSIIMPGESAYFCEDTQQICMGTHLSSTHKTCYYMDNGEELMKRCLKEPYWQIYENQEIEKEVINYSTIQRAKQWECNHKGCVPIGDV